MKSGIIITGLLFLLVITLTNYTQAYQTEIGDDIFIFVQTTVRNSDGQLIAYLESSKFTDLKLESLESFLDLETSRGDDPIISIDEKEYQVIRRVTSKIFQNEDLVASTILSDNLDGQIIMLARFAHDGYTVSAGDTLESMWTFIRPVS
ncbi:MAG: hypothetical protein ACE5DL_04475 [Nitrosopumilaceae archaeon]